MGGIPTALAAGLRSLLTRPMLALWPLLAALVAWLLLAWLLWEPWLSLFEALIAASPARSVLTDPTRGWVPESLGLVFLVVFLVPAVWLTALAIPLVLSAYFNQRLFRYDALAEHAAADEYRAVLRRARPRVHLLGALAGMVQFVPVLNLLGPIYIGLDFVHFFLRELRALRAAPAPVSGPG